MFIQANAGLAFRLGHDSSFLCNPLPFKTHHSSQHGHDRACNIGSIKQLKNLYNATYVQLSSKFNSAVWVQQLYKHRQRKITEAKIQHRNRSISNPVSSLWSSGQSFWLQIQRSRVRFPALPDFLSSSGSGTGSTQPREVN